MYCSGCGNAVSNKLNYCNNCGIRIIKDDDSDSPNSILENLLTTLTFIALGGLGILIGLVTVLLKNGVDHKSVTIIAIFYLAMLFGICLMILNQLPKLITAKLSRKNEMPEVYQPPQIFAKTTAQLEEHREPVLSVTEHTTRNFEKVPLKDK